MKIHEPMEVIENKYPAAESWVFGDSIEMYDKLSALVAEGTKTATSCSYHAYKQVDEEIEIGNEYIVLNGKNLPVCVVRVTAVHLTQFSAMTTELAWLGRKARVIEVYIVGGWSISVFLSEKERFLQIWKLLLSSLR